MGILANVEGRISPPEQAMVPILDRGFLYGDSVYEVIRTYDGAPFALRRHLDRMERTAARIGLLLPPREQIEAEVARTLREAGNADSYCRIIVTRGDGAFGLSPHLATGHRLVILVRPLEVPSAELRARGLRVAVVRTRRNSPLALDPALKTGNYLNNILGLGESQAAGVDDALFLDLQDRVTEASTSNVFFVKEGVVVTPPLRLGMLEGVTRGLVLEAARAEGVLVREEPFGPEALAAADEVFVTSTLREVLAVTKLLFLEAGQAREPELRTVGAGTSGPVAQRLLEAFRERIPLDLTPRP